jgi:hypothetical protein
MDGANSLSLSSLLSEHLKDILTVDKKKVHVTECQITLAFAKKRKFTSMKIEKPADQPSERTLVNIVLRQTSIPRDLRSQALRVLYEYRSHLTLCSK